MRENFKCLSIEFLQSDMATALNLYIHFYLGLKPHGWYLTLVQFGIFAVLSKLELVKTGNQKSRQIPLKVYGIIALVQLGTIGFSNAR